MAHEDLARIDSLFPATGYQLGMTTNAFWRDKHVIITGASSGIGWALAEHVAGLGARLGLTARRKEKLDELAARLRARGHSVVVAAADVRELGLVRSAIRALECDLGPCDVLVANAGTHRYTPGSDFRAESFEDVFSTNVQGVVNAFDAVLGGMVARRRGHIAAVASIAGVLGLPHVGAYSASKAALITLLQSLRVDLAGHNINVTTICPGFIDTPFIASHDRRVLKFMLSASEAAGRIAWAIARGKREYYFPRRTWLLARIARALPFPVYRRVAARVPPPRQDS